MPGETLTPGQSRFLPASLPRSPEQAGVERMCGDSQNEILDILKHLQSGVDNQYTTVCSKLDKVCDRLDALETRQKGLEEELRSSSSCHSSPATPLPGRRLRRTPTALQVNTTVLYPCTHAHIHVFSLQNKIRVIHSSFDEDNRFIVQEPYVTSLGCNFLHVANIRLFFFRITSAHYLQVVNAISAAIGNE